MNPWLELNAKLEPWEVEWVAAWGPLPTGFDVALKDQEIAIDETISKLLCRLMTATEVPPAYRRLILMRLQFARSALGLLASGASRPNKRESVSTMLLDRWHSHGREWWQRVWPKLANELEAAQQLLDEQS